jgi:AcrR family transcriptional regulator
VRGSLDGLSRARVLDARVLEVQRARMLTAAAEVVCEFGYGGMFPGRVSARAGVSRRAFYDVFVDREDCFLAVFEDAVARATALAQDAAAGQSAWRERVRGGLCALLQFIGDEPGLGSLVVVDALSAGPRVLGCRAQRLEILGGVLDQGRVEVRTGVGPPPLTAEGLVAGVLGVLHTRILEQPSGPFTGLLNPLMAVIVLPYLGPHAAAQELNRPAPTTRRASLPRARGPG